MPETELKFALDPQSCALLRERLERLGPAERHILHSVYFDTRRHRLKKAGLALRMRRDGERWIQTVKAKAKNHGGLQRAEEAEAEMPDAMLDLGAIPDARLQKAVKKALKGRMLHPVCETRMERLQLVIHGPGGAAVEVALDEGVIAAGPLSEPFRELELELKSGPLGALYDLAADLLPDGGAAPSTLSKSARGYLLAAEGRIAPEPQPLHAAEVALEPGMQAGEAAAAVFRDCAAQIHANVGAVRHGSDPEGPHQLRIGLRRLRAALKLFAPLPDADAADYLEAEARWLGGLAGLQRDLDVALSDLLDPAAAGGNPALAALRDQAAKRAAANRPVLQGILGTVRVQRFLLALGRHAEATGWDSLNGDAQPLAAAALERSWAKAERRARGIAGHDTEARHALRKALKLLRYQAEFAAPLHPGKAPAKFLKRLKRLQETFGRMNDIAMLETLSAEGGPLAPATPAAAEALAGLLDGLGREAGTQWTAAQGKWDRLRAMPAFWAE
ncbi:CYTH and CHAD domain-containing protein [Mangrovicoccus sp. HB161399]|uniref:CYTH and CHAD domain-containing protein n=1 Tax=Mangrovicoccus sp. HB161399 TaxID=2720392 RepID=UPI0015557192|nr:CYTH and CHAD domain-containing protein [Mangrovicoccus sp. HB161399]